MARPSRSSRVPAYERRVLGLLAAVRRLPGLLTVTIGAALLLALVVGVLRIAAAGHVYPGIRVLDVPVGGLDRSEATARVGGRAAALAAIPVTFRYGTTIWTPSLAEIGGGYDVDASVAAAYEFGRGDQPGDGWLRLVHLAANHTVPLVTRFDQARFDAYLDGLQGQAGSAAVDAAVTIDGSRVVSQPARNGAAFDHATARAAVIAALASLRPVDVTLATQPVPPRVGDAAAAEAKATLERALAAPLTLTLDDRTWTLTPEQIAPALRIQLVERDEAARLGVSVDPSRLAPVLDTVAKDADTAPVDAKVVDNGNRQKLIPAVAGVAVRTGDLAAAVAHALLSGDHSLSVPADRTDPAVTTAGLMASLGLGDVLASGDSNFAGSPDNRATNVRVATSLVDGTLVPPGGTFSYNHAIGSIVEDPGFVPARATEGGVVGMSLGGGVCQVSTTVFRAALRAGLPILEWSPHVYRSPYYEQGGWQPGFDASIAQGDVNPLDGSDLKFANPTDQWLLIRATVSGDGQLSVKLLGTSPGYTVSFDGPALSDPIPASGALEEVDPALPAGSVVEDQPARQGVTVTVVRHVFDAAGDEIATDPFVSPYQPQGSLYRVSPDMRGSVAAGAA